MANHSVLGKNINWEWKILIPNLPLWFFSLNLTSANINKKCWLYDLWSNYYNTNYLIRFGKNDILSFKITGHSHLLFLLEFLKNSWVESRTTDAQWRLFSLKSRTFGPGQTNWANKFWGIWSIFGQTISIHFATVSPFSMFSNI